MDLNITTTILTSNTNVFINDTTVLINGTTYFRHDKAVDILLEWSGFFLIIILFIFMLIGMVIGWARGEESLWSYYLIAHGVKDAPEKEYERLKGCWERKVKGWKKQEIRRVERRVRKRKREEEERRKRGNGTPQGDL
ncbi:hypothetical protein EAF04_005755 [Stromatinia cepivora]|nr:hypothetical protein EAF04_005755 [Stromatinia cepivora]